MLWFQVPPKIDTEGWIADVVKFLALFFFIGLPILRSIRESMQKRAQSGGGPKPPDVDESAREGRQAWEDLMRGSEPAPPAEGSAPVAPAPPPVPTRLPPPLPVPAVEGRAGSTQASAPSPGRAAMDDFRSTSAGSERQAPDEEELVEREIAARDSEGLERAIDRSRQREELAASFERTPEPLLRVEAPSPLGGRRPDPELGTARTEKPARRAQARSKWRRAIVMNEVLGPPVCERSPSDRSRPAALRS